jgi:hypothetical protein
MARVVSELMFLGRQKASTKVKKSLNYSMTSPLAALISFRPTILPMALKRPELWFFTGLHAMLVWLVKSDRFHDVFGDDLQVSDIELSFSSVGMLTSLMTFMLVFFNGQCFTRYQGYYSACTGISGTCQEMAQMTAVHLMDQPDVKWDVCRYLVTSALLIYMKVTDPPGAPMVIDEEEWDRLTQSEEEWRVRWSRTGAPHQLRSNRRAAV